MTAARGARPDVPKQVVRHRCHLDPSEIDGHVTSVVRTVMDCCRSMPFREALAVADAASRVIDLDELRRAGARPGPGRARRVSVTAAADPRAANPFESALRGADPGSI